MALHYNLAKVYEHANNNQSFVYHKITQFVLDIPELLKVLKNSIESKNYEDAYHASIGILSHVEWMGLYMALEDLILIQNWTNVKGKRKEIKEVFKSLELQIEKAIKELKKDHINLV